MKQRVTKLNLSLHAIQRILQSAYPLPSKRETKFCQKGVSLSPKIKFVCISQIEDKGFCNFLKKKTVILASMCMDDICPFVEPFDRTNRSDLKISNRSRKSVWIIQYLGWRCLVPGWKISKRFVIFLTEIRNPFSLVCPPVSWSRIKRV